MLGWHSMCLSNHSLGKICEKKLWRASWDFLLLLFIMEFHLLRLMYFFPFFVLQWSQSFSHPSKVTAARQSRKMKCQLKWILVASGCFETSMISSVKSSRQLWHSLVVTFLDVWGPLVLFLMMLMETSYSWPGPRPDWRNWFWADGRVLMTFPFSSFCNDTKCIN